MERFKMWPGRAKRQVLEAGAMRYSTDMLRTKRPCMSLAKVRGCRLLWVYDRSSPSLNAGSIKGERKEKEQNPQVGDMVLVVYIRKKRVGLYVFPDNSYLYCQRWGLCLQPIWKKCSALVCVCTSHRLDSCRLQFYSLYKTDKKIVGDASPEWNGYIGWFYIRNKGNNHKKTRTLLL
jgi:hypothetical protein